MTTLEQATTDWKVISDKVTNLRNTGNLELTKKYLIRDVELCMNNYKKDHGVFYDPLIPPTQEILDNDDMGGVYF